MYIQVERPVSTTAVMCRRVNRGSQGGRKTEIFEGTALLWQQTPSPGTNRKGNLETPENVWVCGVTKPYAVSYC
jgi:hypothetical protein